MKKKEYVIFLKSQKAELENFLNMTEEDHRSAAKQWSKFLDYRKKFFEEMKRYWQILDILSSPEFRRFA